MQEALSRHIADGELLELANAYFDGDDLNNNALLIAGLIQASADGNVQAFDRLQRILGKDDRHVAEVAKLKTENRILQQKLDILLGKVDVKELGLLEFLKDG